MNSEYHNSRDFFGIFCAWSNIFFFSIMIISDIYIVKCVGNLMERWTINIILSYTISQTLRFVMSIFLINNIQIKFFNFSEENLFVEIAVIIIWVMLYYVTFRIQFIRIQIESKNYEESVKKLKKSEF